METAAAAKTSRFLRREVFRRHIRRRMGETFENYPGRAGSDVPFKKYDRGGTRRGGRGYEWWRDGRRDGRARGCCEKKESIVSNVGNV